MTQEDKQLLLKDLCMRLPYGVRVKFRNYVDICTIKSIDISNTDYYPITLNNSFEQGANIDEVKPYLRPMSSMTEEEIKEFYKIENIIPKVGYICPSQDWHFTVKGLDWLNANHFDYRGLIKKGLGIEVTEENYPYKK